ncbi:MAG: PIG-L family deacetylase [Candidatus Latescibacteria bacterium]|nr:PIG-L family deacetylase [Candidatus Latescibacterota bacterium]
MERRTFIGRTMAGGALLGGAVGAAGPQSAFASQSNYIMYTDDLIIERDVPGKPHKGKVLAAIQPHADDIPIFAGGLVAKLINEGYTGYLINVTNDDHAGPGTVGDTVVANERDNFEIAKVLGLKKVFNLGYRNHRMDNIDRTEMLARMIFLIRALKIDTIIGYDPWGHYEENPDHYITASVCEAASWMAGGGKDYPEHFKAGIKPHGVREKYYHARGPHLVNRVVDISSYIDQRIRSNVANRAQGPAGNHGVGLRERLKREGKKLPILGADDAETNYNYVKEFLLEDEKRLGKEHGLEYAEAFHYLGPGQGYAPKQPEYIKEHAVPLR